MNRIPKSFVYLLAFLVIFMFGWESASYYILKKQAEGTTAVKQEEVSPVAALSSLMYSPGEAKADLSVFWKVWEMVEDLYVDETALDKQQMVYGSIKGMVSSLGDPFTVYMTPSETKEFDQSLNGQLEGIGAELTVRGGDLIVVSPLKNSPAEKAGIKPGDIVYKIDGEMTSDMTLFEAIMNIRGQKGTNVVLTIVRESEKEPFEVMITRDTVNIESVSMEDREGGIYILSINQFNDTTKPEFESKIKELLLLEPKGLILDLRYNGGGYLDISVDIVSEFVKGVEDVVTIKRKEAYHNETLKTNGRASLPSVPLVVLINGGSASASEIVAGAVQDHKRGMVMGKQSFGKGSVQEVDKLPDGSSLRITIAKWYTPAGNNIDQVGITPDIEVSQSDEDAENDIDTQLEAAVKYLREL